MEVQLTPDQDSLERERRRLEILAAVERGEASLARGDGRTVTTREDANQLATEIKRRGVAKLGGEQTAH